MYVHLASFSLSLSLSLSLFLSPLSFFLHPLTLSPPLSRSPFLSLFLSHSLPLPSPLPLQMVGFLDALCGPSASQLKVKDMDKYAFDPKRLLVQITTIVLRVWKQNHPRVSNGGGSPLSTPSPAGGGTTMGKDSFTMSLSNHPDYSQTTMTKCASVLQKQMLGDPALLADFTDFIKQVKS